MADRPGGNGNRPERLDATGSREVVFCHQCENEWYQDTAGLVCPRCEGAFTEVITPESDPRPLRTPSPPPVPRNRPTRYQSLDDSDPEEADIEEHITHGPNGSVLFHRTVRSAPRPIPGRHHHNEEDPDYIMRDFENMIGTLMGTQFRPGQAGRSGGHTLFRQEGAFGGQAYRINNGGSPIVGHRFTFGGPEGQPGADIPGHPGYQHAGDGGPPPVPDLATIIGSLFGAPVGGQPGQQNGAAAQGLPAGLHGLFAAMANPANARSGDAVYTQEALDQIISNLMEQNNGSNAPGPASPEAISALPKKKIDEKELGPEGKAECSVCMDDVSTGVEVVVLPCSHWFHESCATAWLSEHNTCPICRKGIHNDPPRPANSRRSSQGSQSTRNEHRARRMSLRPRMERFTSGTQQRNEARLASIRDNAGMAPAADHYRARGLDMYGSEEYPPPMPGSFYRRRSDISDIRRDDRRTNTSGSDRSRESRSSQSGASNGGGGALGWLRERFSGSGSGQGSGGGNRRSE